MRPAFAAGQSQTPEHQSRMPFSLLRSRQLEREVIRRCRSENVLHHEPGDAIDSDRVLRHLVVAGHRVHAVKLAVDVWAVIVEHDGVEEIAAVYVRTQIVHDPRVWPDLPGADSGIAWVRAETSP